MNGVPRCTAPPNPLQELRAELTPTPHGTQGWSRLERLSQSRRSPFLPGPYGGQLLVVRIRGQSSSPSFPVAIRLLR